MDKSTPVGLATPEVAFVKCKPRDLVYGWWVSETGLEV